MQYIAPAIAPVARVNFFIRTRQVKLIILPEPIQPTRLPGIVHCIQLNVHIPVSGGYGTKKLPGFFSIRHIA